MADLPESSTWHPIDAGRAYEEEAEEAAGKAVMAFKEYARLRKEYVAREKRLNPKASTNALMYSWKDTEAARSCASDLTTYRDLAIMYSQMATMKFTRAMADPEQAHRVFPVERRYGL